MQSLGTGKQTAKKYFKDVGIFPLLERCVGSLLVGMQRLP
jgi:hypothetical protein